MAGRIIAIGDIHGCAQALGALLEAVAPRSDDTIVTLGDYVDRGPDSAGVIERLLKLQDECQLVPLLGNHEIIMLTALKEPQEIAFWRQCGGAATIASYGSLDDIPRMHVEFLSKCKPYYSCETHLFVHANYEPGLDLSDQPESALFWEHLGPEVTRPHRSGKIAVVGHTPQANGCVLDAGHLICLDTYCFGGGWLTAYDIVSGQVWQANEAGEVQ